MQMPGYRSPSSYGRLHSGALRGHRFRQSVQIPETSALLPGLEEGSSPDEDCGVELFCEDWGIVSLDEEPEAESGVEPYVESSESLP